ncbi:MAG TPA: FtsX-like permease family protein [Rectinemataceae bacterium]|nr:FtsX-like permease family protein [Rectinemataceae bacterium]
MTTILIAYRNFVRNGRRFILLGLAIAGGFFVVTVLQSLIDGVTNQINIRGARFYGGQVMILGYQKNPGLAKIGDEAPILKAIGNSGVKPEIISRRVLYGNDGVVFFNGDSVRMRRVIGMDWSVEGPAIGKMEFVSGDPNGMSDPHGILISDVTAKRTGARVGDQVTLQVTRDGGAIDTGTFIVKAIFREASIFGYYTVYVDRASLNLLLGRPAGEEDMIGLYLRDYRQADEVAARVLKAMSALMPVFPPLHNQNELDAARAAPYQGFHYGTLTTMGFMSEIKTMIDALTLVSYAILVLLFVVVVAGIVNLYRVIIYERTKELGTMRAVGMQRAQVRNLILVEAFFLAVCSIAFGLVLSLGALELLSLFRLNAVAGFDIFLDRGRLSWVMNLDTLGFDAALIALVTLIGAWSPARAAQAIEPVVALSAE